MSAASRFVVVTGFDAVLLRLLLLGVHMQSVLEILAVNTKEGVGKKSGQPYKIMEAHCVLRNDDGSAAAVGVLTVPKVLEESAKVGIYRAGFSLEAPTFGENQGKIVAALKSLLPVAANQLRPAVKAA